MNARIKLGRMAQQQSQMLKRKFADWQNIRVAAFHRFIRAVDG
jgi:hypothetical protein